MSNALTRALKNCIIFNLFVAEERPSGYESKSGSDCEGGNILYLFMTSQPL